MRLGRFGSNPATGPARCNGNKGPDTMKTATYTDEQAAADLGHARGSLPFVSRDNRGHVRRWLNSQGFPGAFTAGLSLIELKLAYNDTTGRAIENLKKKLGDAAEQTQADFGAEAPEAPKTNGHELSTEARGIARAL